MKRVGGVVSAIAALVACAYHWGFSVDDAGITARYAVNLANGRGYRFNLDGPPTDGVTPLPFTPMVALFSHGKTVDQAFDVARVMGAVAWIAAAAALGVWTAGRGEKLVRWVPLALLWLSVPVAAWSVSGMETGIVVALVTFAATMPETDRGRLAGAALAGAAAAFRPEMIPFAGVFGLGRAWQSEGNRRRALVLFATALPAMIVVAARLIAFGAPVPASYYAKPAVLEKGIEYVAMGLLLGGAPALALAPIALAKSSALRSARWLLLACLVHVAALVMAGGDWMGLWRLMTPIYPLFAMIGVDVAEHVELRFNVLRWVFALGATIVVWITIVPRERWRILAQRDEIVTRAREATRGLKMIATMEIGWAGSATDASFVDLCGVTDPEIARLPGSHVDKAITAELLKARGTDALMLRRRDNTPAADVRPDHGPYFRAAEERIVKDPWVLANFAPMDEITVEAYGPSASAPKTTYVLWKRR